MKAKITKSGYPSLEKLFDSYQGNLLNYFSGMTPKQSKQFNETQKKLKSRTK